MKKVTTYLSLCGSEYTTRFRLFPLCFRTVLESSLLFFSNYTGVTWELLGLEVIGQFIFNYNFNHNSIIKEGKIQREVSMFLVAVVFVYLFFCFSG